MNLGFVYNLSIRISNVYFRFMAQKQKTSLILRPPVVVIMGHVDHGKSSILEAIKDLKILAKESGGITQHIGAYEVEKDGKKITFIDTPGHEIFSQMRSRGAKIADIAILVIAAEEGIKPQTKEAISHIKSAGIPFIVAINKIDKPTADPQRVKRELSQEGILVESMGGKIPSVNVSTFTKEGIEELLEMVNLTAEIEEFSADISVPAEGVVIEALMDPLKGPTSTLLVSKGTLKIGDVIGTSSAFGKIKNLSDFQGNSVKEALPAMPVIVFGFENVPMVGEGFSIFPDIESAKLAMRKKELGKKRERVISDNVEESDRRTLNLIIKADVLGSLEAIEGVLASISVENYKLKILKSEVGMVNESDVKLAKGSNAKILAFRVKANPVAKILAEREKVKIIIFEVVYELVETVRKLMDKMIEPEIIRVDIGKIKILAVFLTEKNRQILGGKVIDGEARKRTSCEIFRNDERIGAGKIINLQRNKKEEEKVQKGDECGMLHESDVKVQEGDVLALYTKESKKESL